MLTRRAGSARRVPTNGELEALIERAVAAAFERRVITTNAKLDRRIEAQTRSALSKTGVRVEMPEVSEDLRGHADGLGGALRRVENPEHGSARADDNDAAAVRREHVALGCRCDCPHKRSERQIFLNGVPLNARPEGDFQVGHDSSSVRDEHDSRRVRRRMPVRVLHRLLSTVGETTDNPTRPLLRAGLLVRVAAVLRAAATRLEGRA